MRRSNYAVSALALAAMVAPAAQATAQSQTDPTAVEDIVVVGARLQSERAVEAKRELEVISDSVTGDEAGSLPDFGLGEALDRVPGVSTLQNNARGEAQLISIRGLNADYNLVQVDGVALPTTETNRRSVSLDVIPSSIAQRVEVYKTRTPDMDGNAVGGIVNLRTRSAFDRSGRFLSGRMNLGAYDNERRYRDTTPSGQAEVNFSDRFGPDGKFGIVLAGGYFRRDSSSLNSAIDNYLYYDAAGVRLSNANAADYAVAAPNRRRWYTYDNLRQRYGGLAKLEYRDSNFESHLTYGDFHHRNDEQRQSNSLYISGNAANLTPTSGSAERATAQVDLAEYYERRRIQYWDSALKWRPAERSEVALALNYAISSYEKDSYLETYRTSTTASLAYDYEQADAKTYPVFVSRNPDFYYGAANYRLIERGPTYDENEERAFSGALDYRYNMDRKAEGLGFAVGGKARLLDRDYDLVSALYTPASGRTVTLAGLTMPDRYHPYNGGNDYIIAIDRAAAEAAFAATPSNYRAAADDLADNLSADYALTEDVFAGYALVRYRGDRFDLTAGARYEDTRLETASNISRSGTWAWEAQSQRYDDLLPSLTANFDLTDQLRLRFGASQTIGRPNYDLLAARYTITEGAASRTITGGNPNLRPRRSDNFDLSAEYYFAPRSALAIGLFRRAVHDEIIRVVSTQVEGSGDDEITVRTSMPVNSGDLTLDGVELSLSVPSLGILSPALDTLGFAANFSLVDPTPLTVQMDDGSMRRLPGLYEGADRFGNLTLFYSLRGLSAQIAYNYKSSQLVQISTSSSVLDRSLGDSHVIDAQVRYRITPQVGLIIQGKNLGNNRPTRWTGPEQDLIREEIDNGSSYFVGLNFRF